MRELDIDELDAVAGGNALDAVTGSFSTFNAQACGNLILSWSGAGSFVGGLIGSAFGGVGSAIGSFIGWGGGSKVALQADVCQI